MGRLLWNRMQLDGLWKHFTCECFHLTSDSSQGLTDRKDLGNRPVIFSIALRGNNYILLHIYYEGVY